MPRSPATSPATPDLWVIEIESRDPHPAWTMAGWPGAIIWVKPKSCVFPVTFPRDPHYRCGSRQDKKHDPNPPSVPQNTTPIPSRFSRAWKRCASVRACISAIPTTARACITWSMRSWTTASTRNAGGICRFRPRQDPRRQQRLGPVTMPQHPRRHAPDRGRQRRRGQHLPASRRRANSDSTLLHKGVGRFARRVGVSVVNALSDWLELRLAQW